jgi:plasmid replication initiation protein
MDNNILREDEAIDFYQDTLLSEDNYLVYKRNELIHAKFDLSTFSQKTMVALIARIDPRREELPVFEFNISELAHILGVSKQRVFSCIDEVTTELQSQVVKLEVRDKAREIKIKNELEAAKIEGREPKKFVHSKNKSFDKFNWFEVSSYRQEEGIIRFKFNSRMDNYLLDFNSNFTKYSLPNVLKMNSKYAIRLYEIFRSFLSTKSIASGKKEIFRVIQYDTLREMLGISPKSIKKFYDFERSVLKQAKKELDKTDLSFSYSFPERKLPSSRKKITKIRFCIYHQKNTLVGEDWMDSLKKWVRADKYSQLITKHGEDRVRRNVELIITQIEDGRDIKNIVAYVSSAISLDYADTEKALDPYSYTDKIQRDFVKQRLLPNWDKIDKASQDDFLSFRFSKGLVADNFEKYISESGQRSITAAIMDIQDTNW